MWFHSRCCAVSDELYYALANSSCSWICFSCALPNFSSPLFTISDLSTPNKFDSLSSLSESGIFAASTPILNKTKSQCSSASTSYSLPKKKNKIIGMILNCNGLKGLDHITQFQALLDLQKPYFVLGTESKLCPDISSYSIFPPDYTILRKDRNRFGGGVFPAIKSDLACVEEFDLAVDDCEIIWTSLRLANCKILYLSSYYRPPKSSTDSLDLFSESVRRVFAKVSNHRNIIIGGDFNLGDISWDAATSIPTPSYLATASIHHTFLQILDDYSLSQHVNVPTRPAYGKTLDLLLSTFPNSVGDLSTTTGLIDQLAVIFEINLKPTNTSKPPHKVYL